MVTFAKTSKFQRVRAVALVRRPVGAGCFVFSAAIALLCILSSTAMGAERLTEELNQKMLACSQNLSDHFSPIFHQLAVPNDEDEIGSVKCPENSKAAEETQLRAEVNLKNFDARNKTLLRGLQNSVQESLRIGDKVTPVDYRQRGACEIGYAGMDWVLKVLVEERKKLCRETLDTLQQNFDCYNNQNIKDCTESIRKMSRALEDDYSHTRDLVGKLKKYLDQLKKQNEGAVKDYSQDLSRFNAQGNRLTADVSSVTIDPRRGGVSTPEAYLERLVKLPANRDIASFQGRVFRPGPAEWGEIILEQKRASDVSHAFMEKLDSYLVTQQRFKESLDKAGFKDYKPPTTNNDWMTKAGQFAPVAGTAASGLSGVVGATPNAAAAALPLAAAAGAGAALSRQNASSSSLGSAFEAGAMGMSQGAAKNATVEATNLAPTAPAAAAGGVLPTLAAEGPGEKKEKASDDERSPASAGGTFIPGALAASGSSMTTGKAAGGKTTATTGGSGGTEGLLDAFSDDLKPATAVTPPKKSSDGMTEVTNMLGQMKNLFNFDDNGSQPPADPNAFEPVASSEASPAAGGDEFNDGFTYGGNYDTVAEGTSAEDEALSSLGPGASREEIAQAAQFGSVSTPLFQRVHRRHRVAIERGLVVQEFGRLPQ